MESNINTSKLSVQFGDDISADSVKTSAKFEVHFNKNEAQKQFTKIQEIRGKAQETGYALVVAFNTTADKLQELQDFIGKFFKGEIESEASQFLSSLVQGNNISYDITAADTLDKVVVTVQPGSSVLSEFEEQLNGFLQVGINDLAETQENNIKFNLASSTGFSELNGHIAGGVSVGGAFLKGFNAELLLNLNQELIPKVLDIVANFEPNITKTVFNLLRFFKNLQVVLKLASSAELPDYLQKTILNRVFKNDSIHLPSAINKEALKKFVGLLENGVDVYAVAKDLVSLSLHLGGNGFGTFLTKDI